MKRITISGLQEGSCETMGQISDYLDTLLARYSGQSSAAPSNPFDLNTAGKQGDYYRDLIENGAPIGERSEKFQEVVWHLASSGLTIEQIVDELAKYPNGIGLKYANRLMAEVTRSFSKWWYAQTGCRPPQQSTQQTISNPAPSWWPYCLRDQKGHLLSNLSNAMLALRNDTAVRDMFAYDEMRCSEMLMQNIRNKPILAAARPVRDADIIALQEWFQLNGLLNIGIDVVHKAVDLRARERSFHPVRDYLDSLQWDGESRVENWLINYLG